MDANEMKEEVRLLNLQKRLDEAASSTRLTWTFVPASLEDALLALERWGRLVEFRHTPGCGVELRWRAE